MTKSEQATKLMPSIMITAILIPMVTGITSAIISSEGMKAYATLSKPPLSPPAWAFSVAWTILYCMMGIASYYVFISDKKNEVKKTAIGLYAGQLILNFFWSIIFFVWKQYLAAFICLVVLLLLVVLCAYHFFRIKKSAGLMLVPYILWLCFAGYLNFASYLMN